MTQAVRDRLLQLAHLLDASGEDDIAPLVAHDLRRICGFGPVPEVTDDVGQAPVLSLLPDQGPKGSAS